MRDDKSKKYKFYKRGQILYVDFGNMMMATMRFMRTMITTGIATGAMMTMQPVWMMQWKMKIGKSGRETHE